FEKNVYTAKARNVYITTENVTGIHTSSGAALRTENTLQTDRLILSTSSGSSIKTHVNAKEVEMSSSSGSSAKLEGITNSLTLRASSGSNIDANRLQTIDTYAKASSGANIDLYVSGTLNAYASSGGNIRYEGKPNRVNKENSSGGKISGK
ncbi:MAG: DUF2807 domain-containing protein, partial [Lutibacter sp.]|nr:DUF2807 domain-containing protein [Lutibacter sp.]